MSAQSDKNKLKIAREVEKENGAEMEEGQGGIAIAPPSMLKRKRNLPGRPDPNSEVIKLSPKQLTAASNFTCEVCNRGFLRHQNLQLHRRGHNLPWQLHNPSTLPPRKKVFVCPVETCIHHNPSRALGDLSGIKKHFVRKHGEKIWRCNKCEKRYAIKADLVTHSTTCGSQRYKCTCGIFFSKKNNFMTHQICCTLQSDKRKEEQASDSNPPPVVNPSSFSSGDAPPPIHCICGITFSSMETMDLHKLFCYKTITETIKIKASESSTTNVFDDNIFGNRNPKIGHPLLLESSLKMDTASILLRDKSSSSEMNFMPINSIGVPKEATRPIGMKNVQEIGNEMGSMTPQLGFQKLLDQANPIADDGLENLLELDSFCKDISKMEDRKIAEDDCNSGGGGGSGNDEVHDIGPSSMFNDYPWMDDGVLGLGTSSVDSLNVNNNHWFNFSATTGFGPASFDSVLPSEK